MKPTTIIIAAGVVVVGYFAFKKLKSMKAQADTDRYAANYGQTTQAPPGMYWNGTAWEPVTPPNGAPPSKPGPLDHLATLSAEAWGVASGAMARKQPPIGAATLPAERVTATTLHIPAIS